MTTYWILLSHCGSAAVLTKREQERDGILASGGTIVEQAYFPEPNAEACLRTEDEQCQICGAPTPCRCNEDVL